jgi:hypothetical protein
VWGTPNNNNGSILTDVIMFGSREINTLSPYLEAGGKLLLCGEQPMTVSIDNRVFTFHRFGPAYPFIFRYELAGNQFWHGSVPGPGEELFAYNDCCVNVVDIAWGLRLARGSFLICSTLGQREYSSKNDGIRVALPIDRVGGDGYVFPPLELRPEVSDPGRYFHESSISLKADIYNPPYFASCTGAELVRPRGCFEPIYGLGCLNENSVVYGAPIAFWTSRWAHVPNPAGVAARSAVWGFAPVYFNPAQVREALEIIMFDEWQLQRISAERIVNEAQGQH